MGLRLNWCSKAMRCVALGVMVLEAVRVIKVITPGGVGIGQVRDTFKGIFQKVTCFIINEREQGGNVYALGAKRCQ